MSSVPVEKAEYPNILLGNSPERDREIDGIRQMIRNVSRAGIPTVKYNFKLPGVVRTESTPGRGTAIYSTFNYEKAREEPPLTIAGRASEDEMWGRITNYLEPMVPVAVEYEVKLACYPYDPPMPRGKGFRGVPQCWVRWRA